MRSVIMDYQKILACPSDCILYRKEYEHLEKCQMCGRSWYKTNDKSPAKVLWYFQIIPRFKHLFKNVEHAKSLTWYSDGRIIDRMLWPPVILGYSPLLSLERSDIL